MSVHRDCHSYNCNMYSAGHDKLILDKENKICLKYFPRENENTPVELSVALFHCVLEFNIVKLWYVFVKLTDF